MTAALAGKVVLSVGHTLPGLYCLAALRDLGAEVVRVERFSRGERRSPYSALAGQFPTRSLTAGTHALALDLKIEEGRAAFVRLSRRAAVVLEGFRPGVAARLGIDAARLRDGNEALVHASISGYGQTGLASQRVGHDVNYLAETGVLGASNPLGLPGATFADGLAGLSAALNVVAALHPVATTGRGQILDLAIVDGPLFLMATELEAYGHSGISRGPGATHLTGRYPWYAIHPTRDGGAIALGAVEPAFHARLCEAIGHPELANRQFAEGEEARQAWAAFREFFASHTRDEAMAILGPRDACASPVLSVAEVAASPLLERAKWRPAEPAERSAAGSLVRTPVRSAMPAAGALATERHGADVLERFGFTSAEVGRLISAGALEDRDE